MHIYTCIYAWFGTQKKQDESTKKINVKGDLKKGKKRKKERTNEQAKMKNRNKTHDEEK